MLILKLNKTLKPCSVNNVTLQVHDLECIKVKRSKPISSCVFSKETEQLIKIKNHRVVNIKT